MEIFIQHQGQQTGPFSPQEIQAGVASGLYQNSDLVWYQGATGWIPLANLSHMLSGSPDLPPTAIPENSGLAITSMVLGISGFICLVTAVPAVICGHIALAKIKQSNGRLVGGGFAIAGLITGYICTIVLVLAFLAGLAAPMVIRQRKKADLSNAMSNAKTFGLALNEFESEYGSYPNPETAANVAEDTGTPAETDSSSNARFRQLFRAGMITSEWEFYAKTKGSRKPDGDISGNNALAPGECGFGYFENVRNDDGVARPLALAPFKIGSEEFDPMPFDGKAVILWSDNSVRSHDIERTSGEVIFDGQNLLDPAHPVWGGVPPSLLLPEWSESP